MQTDNSLAFVRTIQLIGPDGFERLQKSHVAIFGAGAVGSFAAENIVRSGIGELTLVDFDKITLSNVNRQLAALHSTVGQDKINALGRRLLDINPDLNLHLHAKFIDEQTLTELLKPTLHFVVDAIDSFTPKLNLIKMSRHFPIPVISSMGAAGRLDPTQVQIGRLDQTTVCPLAKRLRKFLRRCKVNTDQILTIYSTETPRKPLPPEQTVQEYHYARGRARSVQGSVSFIPAIFGSYMAAIVVNALLEQVPVPAFCQRLLK